MKNLVSFFAILVLATTPCYVARAESPSANFQSDELSWRANRATRLQAPEGWLSLIGLEWLKQGNNSFGSATDNVIPIAGKAPAHVAIVSLDKGALRLVTPPGGFPKDLTVDGHAPQEQVLYADDGASPSKLKFGTFTVIIIHRDERYGLRIKDTEAPTRTGFHGLKWYAPDPAYLIKARWIPYNPPKMIEIPTILGTVDKLPAPGAAEFTINGQTARLEPVLEDPSSTDLFFIMRDATSKTTTYGAGRFLYTGFPDHGLNQPGEIVLDFNQLVNPPCAFTPYATCPLPPTQNRLTVAIPAGEQRYHD
jgi:uncharacterized protein